MYVNHRIRIFLGPCLRSGHVRFSHNKALPIAVVTAARTPCGKYQGQLAALSAWELGQLAVEAAVKRSAIPLDQINHIFMNERQLSQQEQENKFIFTHFLKKAKYTPIAVEANTELDSFLIASEFIKSHPQAVAVAGGFSSATSNRKNQSAVGDRKDEVIANYVSNSLAKYTKSLSEAVFDAELVPLKVIKQQGQSRVVEEIFQDETCTEEFEDYNKEVCDGDGASAVVITSSGNAQELNLSPLAVIKGFQYLRSTESILQRSLRCLEQLFATVGIQAHQVKHWEIDDALPQLVLDLEDKLNLNSELINPHGGSLILSGSPLTSFTRLLTHISHALHPSEYGCVVFNSCHTSTTLILQKPFQSPVATAHRLPVVTLYTKNPCPLCDILVEELEHNFPGEYELEKVFIDTKENVRFLRLYRYDIPVVFLNNQFLCMHRLNHRLFRRRLGLLKSDA